MTAANKVVRPAFEKSALDSLISSRQEPAWSVDMRRDAWRIFSELDWPDRRSEEWLRTDYRTFRLDRFSPVIEQLSPDAQADRNAVPIGALAEGIEVAGQVTCLDSHPLDVRLAEKWQQKGVIFGSLDQLIGEHGDLLKPYFQRQIVRAQYDRFAALNAAFWSGGQLLYVPRNVVINEPLHCLSAIGKGGVDLGRLLVIIEEGAEATLLCETLSTNDTGTNQTGTGDTGRGLHCGVAEVVVNAGAHFRLVHLQNWNRNVFHFAHQRAIVDRDATLQWTIAAMGSRLAKVNQQVALVAPGANCQVNGVLFTEDKQHINYQTLQHHQAPHCVSDFLYKSALRDTSRTVWRGMIKVDVGAMKTNGYQRNDNLLLSDAARADSIPGLEIEADDVRCTHGSTSGRVDEELVFYLQCRGLTRTEAIRAIVTGFFQQIFDRITIDSVREVLGSAIARRVRAYK